MKATELKYTKRFNTGPYEHEEITVHAILDESGDDDTVECLKELKNTVVTAQKEAADKTSDAPAETKSGKGKGKNENKNGKGKPKDEEEIEETEETEEEESDETDSDEGEELDEQEEESEEEDQDPPPKKTATKSGKGKLKVTPYSRNNETHKKLFSSELAKINPKWKASDAGKKKAKELSKALDGEDFLGADGEVLISFKVAMKKGMK